LLILAVRQEAAKVVDEFNAVDMLDASDCRVWGDSDEVVRNGPPPMRWPIFKDPARPSRYWRRWK